MSSLFDTVGMLLMPCICAACYHIEHPGAMALEVDFSATVHPIFKCLICLRTSCAQAYLLFLVRITVCAPASESIMRSRCWLVRYAPPTNVALDCITAAGGGRAGLRGPHDRA